MKAENVSTHFYYQKFISFAAPSARKNGKKHSSLV